MSLAPRRSSSPIRKPSRPITFFRNIPRAATYPCISYPFPISPNSCFTDDNALEQLLSHSLPTRPSSPSPSHPFPPSPASSDVTQFPFLLPDPIQPLNTDTMSTSENNSHHRSSSSRNNNTNNNNNNNSDRNPSRHSATNASTSRRNNRRRRTSGANNNESSSRRTSRRTSSTPNASLRCDICHQYYSRRDNLRAHQRVHTGDRPYQCRFCAQRFRWLGALRNHEAIHERDGDHPLNPPPPGARQPIASSSRQPSASSSHQVNTGRPTDHNRSTSQPQASPTRTQSGPASSSSHRLQGTPPAQRHRTQPSVPDIDFNLDAPGAQIRPSLFFEGEPQVSPLYTGSHENCYSVLDDAPEERSRD